MNTPTITWNERLHRLRRRLDLNQDEFGSRLGITREWVSKLESGRAAVSEILQIKLANLERELGSQTYQKLSAAAAGMVREGAAAFPPNPMRITPGHEPPAAEPTELDCLNYFQAYLQHMRTTPGGLGHTYIELQRHFPLPDSPEERTSSQDARR